MRLHQANEVAQGADSWERLHQGSPEAFVEALCQDALAHSAVDHPYLRRLAAGDLPDPELAIRDYCHQYYFYSAAFPSYLKSVLQRLEDPVHREMILQNLHEEQGRDPANPENIPHTELFQRFRRAAGVDEAYDAEHGPCATVQIWRDQFLQTCGSQHPGVGLGAIGIATEMIVSRVYAYLHQAVVAHTEMTPDDFLFLTLHMECDDGHADQMKRISVELAEDRSHREALRFGVLTSLNLRSTFWDVMLQRALAQ